MTKILRAVLPSTPATSVTGDPHAAAARGTKLVRRHGPLAVLFAPTRIAGVYHVKWRTFLPWNLIAASTWTLVTALGGYWIGPGMARGLGVANAASLAAGVILAGAAGFYLWRRTHPRHDRPQANGPGDPAA